MSRFITGSELNSEIEKLIKEAAYDLIFVSPYIKLHDRLKDELKSNPNRNELKVTVVFGKNEDKVSKSLAIEELDFFKMFPNLEIRYERRLHAKYYANEFSSILTSMNLYDFSIDKNIEFGVLSEKNSILKNKLDSESIGYFSKVIDNAEVVFRQEAIIKKSLGGLKKSFEGIKIIEDNIAEYYNTSRPSANKQGFKPSLKSKEVPSGFCIRSGVRIEFNPKMPMSNKAYQSWTKFKNKDYPEKFCHFSGESSNGETSFNRPILRKNWKEASKYIKS